VLRYVRACSQAAYIHEILGGVSLPSGFSPLGASPFNLEVKGEVMGVINA